MRYSISRALVGIACIAVAAGTARAQLGPGGGMPGVGSGSASGATAAAADDKDKKDTATEAPKAALLPTTPALPPMRARKKHWKMLELGGYWRMRTDWFKNFNLNYIDDPANPIYGGSPFPRALGCTATEVNHPCDDSLASANMRLRLEPVFNIDDGTSVHVQADALDNLVLGSTPTGEAYNNIYTSSNPPPLTGAFNNGTQAPPVRGVNNVNDSFVIKRAWAEVATPIGIVKAGRMPNSWGMGIYHNSGGYDPISGDYDYDGDYGDTVDRLSFSAQIPGTPLRAMIAADWDLTRLVSSQTNANTANPERPYDLDNASNTNGYVAVISKLDSPQDFKDTVDRGDTALNYGVYLEYKGQKWDEDLTGFTEGGTFDSADHYIPRNLKSYTADLWGKIAFGGALFEGELVGQTGSVENLQNLTAPDAYTTERIRKAGGALRFTYKALDNKLKVGLEAGFATGDKWANTPRGNTNVAYANLLGMPSECSSATSSQSNCTLTQFMFNPEYKVDLILWRRLIGAVTNAAYFKPFISYEITKGLVVKLSDVTSLALKQASTPGDSLTYGNEIDADIGYQTGHLYTGISGGVLFPFGAMSHPEDSTAVGGTTFGYGSNTTTGEQNFGDPGTAYSVQTRLVLAF